MCAIPRIEDTVEGHPRCECGRLRSSRDASKAVRGFVGGMTRPQTEVERAAVMFHLQFCCDAGRKGLQFFFALPIPDKSGTAVVEG